MGSTDYNVQSSMKLPGVWFVEVFVGSSFYVCQSIALSIRRLQIKDDYCIVLYYSAINQWRVGKVLPTIVKWKGDTLYIHCCNSFVQTNKTAKVSNSGQRSQQKTSQQSMTNATVCREEEMVVCFLVSMSIDWHFAAVDVMWVMRAHTTRQTNRASQRARKNWLKNKKTDNTIQRAKWKGEREAVEHNNSPLNKVLFKQSNKRAKVVQSPKSWLIRSLT